jgi:hypothetical protein
MSNDKTPKVQNNSVYGQMLKQLKGADQPQKHSKVAQAPKGHNNQGVMKRTGRGR